MALKLWSMHVFMLQILANSPESKRSGRNYAKMNSRSAAQAMFGLAPTEECARIKKAFGNCSLRINVEWDAT